MDVKKESFNFNQTSTTHNMCSARYTIQLLAILVWIFYPLSRIWHCRKTGNLGTI